MMELRRRYQNLYIPSDFFDAQFTWVDAFPMPRPFQLGNYCNFYVMQREVDPLDKNTAVLDPADADHLYSAKVCVASQVPHLLYKSREILVLSEAFIPVIFIFSRGLRN